MNTKTIKSLFAQGYGMDAVYQVGAGNLGLFGVAFFGHKGTSKEKAKLNRLWSKIVNQYHKGL